MTIYDLETILSAVRQLGECWASLDLAPRDEAHDAQMTALLRSICGPGERHQWVSNDGTRLCSSHAWSVDRVNIILQHPSTPYQLPALPPEPEVEGR